MSLYSTQFYKGPVGGSTSMPLYTVPAGNVVVLRDLELFLSSAGLFNLQLVGSGASAIVWYISGASANSWHQWQGRTVAHAGDTIQAFCDGSGSLLLVSGYLLTI